MPSTHLQLYVHIVFSTHGRRPVIERSWRPRLHSYLGGLVRGLDAVAEAVGGTTDHVHLLVSLGALHRLADFTRQLKGQSSRWVHENLSVKGFSWQEGYGAFSVSASRLAAVKRYIERQDQHHRSKTFQEEYLEFLHQNGIDYDERYLW